MDGAGTSSTLRSSAGDEFLDLPPGFRFHPTDEELITHYLSPKVVDPGFHARAIAEVDLNKCEPWDLPRKAKLGEKEWYFFCMRDRKYPTGMRTNRATEAGYWKATGKDKEVYRGRNILVGMKKTLVFYRGRAPKGEKSNWVMHEYRLEGKFSYYNVPKASKDEWVVCRIFQKSSGIKIRGPSGSDQLLTMNSFGDELDSSYLPPLLDSPSCFPLTETDDDFKTFHIPRFSSTCMDGQGINNQKLLLESYPHLNQANPYMAAAGFNPQTRNSLDVPGGTLFPYYDLGPISDDHKTLRTMAVANYDQQQNLMLRQCKEEQNGESYGRFSNQSMVTASQDTGLSTDVTAEISSVVSRNRLGDQGAPSSSGGPVDLECLWDY